MRSVCDSLINKNLNAWRLTMKCPKCKGRMYSEKYYDFVRAFDAWKCCACGEVVDPTILANRARNHSVYIG